MPYVNQEIREKFKDLIAEMDKVKMENKGELEFLIFSLQRKYIAQKEWNYTNLHDTVYAASHCGDEFRRRFLDDREDFAIQSNGDIL